MRLLFDLVCGSFKTCDRNFHFAGEVPELPQVVFIYSTKNFRDEFSVPLAPLVFLMVSR